MCRTRDVSPPDSSILRLVFHLRFVITSVCCFAAGGGNINQIGLTYAFVFVAEL